MKENSNQYMLVVNVPPLIVPPLIFNVPPLIAICGGG